MSWHRTESWSGWRWIILLWAGGTIILITCFWICGFSLSLKFVHRLGMGPENGEVAECSSRKLFEWKFQHLLKNITSCVNSSLTTNSGRRTIGQTEEHLQDWGGICKREITHPGWRSCLLWADPGILVARGSSDSRHRNITISAMPLKPLKIDKFSTYFIGEFPKSGETFPLTS